MFGLFSFRYADQDIVLPVQSARIRTINSFSFLYGRVEVRAKLPRGDWLWPGNVCNILISQTSRRCFCYATSEKSPHFFYKFSSARCKENTVHKHLFCLYWTELNGELCELYRFNRKPQSVSRHSRDEEESYTYWEQNLVVCSPWLSRHTKGAFPDMCEGILGKERHK